MQGFETYDLRPEFKFDENGKNFVCFPMHFNNKHWSRKMGRISDSFVVHKTEIRNKKYIINKMQPKV